MAGAADGIVLPKPRSPADVFAVAELMDRLEDPERGEPAQILALAGETARGLMSLHEYPPRTAPADRAELGLGRPGGPTWGALRRRREDGSLLPLYEIARALTLAAATVADVDAIEAVYADFRNLDGFRRFTEEALEMGYVGGAAIHPAQVEVLNEVFSAQRRTAGRGARDRRGFRAVRRNRRHVDSRGKWSTSRTSPRPASCCAATIQNPINRTAPSRVDTPFPGHACKHIPVGSGGGIPAADGPGKGVSTRDGSVRQFRGVGAGSAFGEFAGYEFVDDFQQSRHVAVGALRERRTCRSRQTPAPPECGIAASWSLILVRLDSTPKDRKVVR